MLIVNSVLEKPLTFLTDPFSLPSLNKQDDFEPNIV